MAYVDKNNNISSSSILELGVVKNTKNQTANSYLSVYTVLNVITNTVSTVTYTVGCFDNKETEGYFYKQYSTYAEAKVAFDALPKSL